MRQNSYCTKQVVFLFGQYLEKYVRYSLNIELGHPQFQKSFKKQSQALKIYITRLLVSIFHLPLSVLININLGI